jgi:glycosyltransferase involved in cell wall biosynthesis
MKIGWLYPLSRRCGVTFYGDAYTAALEPLAEIVRVDSDKAIADCAGAARALNACDIVHVQYEPSLFFQGRRDRYESLLGRIKRPVVVSLHEVYEEFPWDFPRSRITGTGLVRSVKEYLYDQRHPVSTAYRKHLSAAFFGTRLLIHHRYHRDILVNAGIDGNAVDVITHPVPAHVDHGDPQWREGEILQLGYCGFVSESYDFELLGAVLGALTIPWHFTWIGTTRRDEDRSLESKLHAMIEANHWADRFTITGWVDDAERNRLLGTLHLYAAWFRYRSSSGSIAVALANGCLIMGTDIPCLAELADDFGIIAVAPPTAGAQVVLIGRLIDDTASGRIIRQKIRTFVRSHTYDETAPRLIDIYASAAS